MIAILLAPPGTFHVDGPRRCCIFAGMRNAIAIIGAVLIAVDPCVAQWRFEGDTTATWEQAISRQLLTEAGRRIYFAEHGLEGLLRGDSASRAAFYHAAITDGWMQIDEVRQLENLPRLK